MFSFKGNIKKFFGKKSVPDPSVPNFNQTKKLVPDNSSIFSVKPLMVEQIFAATYALIATTNFRYPVVMEKKLLSLYRPSNPIRSREEITVRIIMNEFNPTVIFYDNNIELSYISGKTLRVGNTDGTTSYITPTCTVYLKKEHYEPLKEFLYVLEDYMGECFDAEVWDAYDRCLEACRFMSDNAVVTSGP